VVLFLFVYGFSVFHSYLKFEDQASYCKFRSIKSNPIQSVATFSFLRIIESGRWKLSPSGDRGNRRYLLVLHVLTNKNIRSIKTEWGLVSIAHNMQKLAV
jgi:hypothetical protein